MYLTSDQCFKHTYHAYHTSSRTCDYSDGHNRLDDDDD